MNTCTVYTRLKRQTDQRFFGTVVQVPITEQLHEMTAGVERAEVADDHFATGLRPAQKTLKHFYKNGICKIVEQSGTPYHIVLLIRMVTENILLYKANMLRMVFVQ